MPSSRYLLPLALIGLSCLLFPGCGGDDGGPAPVLSVSIDPDSTGVEVCATLSIEAEVANGEASEVNWYVNGVLGGNSAIGTISQANPATYTAPEVIPIPSAVTIKVCLEPGFDQGRFLRGHDQVQRDPRERDRGQRRYRHRVHHKTLQEHHPRPCAGRLRRHHSRRSGRLRPRQRRGLRDVPPGERVPGRREPRDHDHSQARCRVRRRHCHSAPTAPTARFATSR